MRNKRQDVNILVRSTDESDKIKQIIITESRIMVTLKKWEIRSRTSEKPKTLFTI